jgi:hypothetical protein
MNLNSKSLPVVASLFLTVPAFSAEPPSVEDRLKQLEDTVQTLKKENTDLKKELGWDGKSSLTFVKPGGKEAKVTLGGFVQGQTEFGKEPDARYAGIEDRFLLRRARVNLQGSFLEHFDFKVEADFGANSLSEKTGYSAQLTDAYINWNQYDFANLKFGQFKTPFGYEQLVSDTKLLTIERSLSNDRLTDGRQIGLGISGDFLDKRVGYSAGAFNGTGVNNSFNDNDNFLYAGRVTGVPFEGKIDGKEARWSIGVNGLGTHDDGVSKSGFGFTGNSFAGNRYSWGVDSQLKWWLFGLEAEYLRSHFEPANNVPDDSFDAAGWYVMGTAYVLPKKLQALVKYEQFDPNLSIGGNKTDIYTFGLTYYVKGDDLKVALNYMLGNPAGGQDNQGRLLGRVQVVF